MLGFSPGLAAVGKGMDYVDTMEYGVWSKGMEYGVWPPLAESQVLLLKYGMHVEKKKNRGVCRWEHVRM